MTRGSSWDSVCDVSASGKVARFERPRLCRRRVAYQPTLMVLEAYQLLSIMTVATFNGSNGDSPVGALALDGQGNLFGVTQFGGASNAGTAFELASGSTTVNTLVSFDGSTEAEPQTGIVIDNQGNLYGTSDSGADNTDGSVFEIPHGSSTATPIAHFDGTDGLNPVGGLVRDAQGNLYGTTNAGGANNDGTVFEVVNGSQSITLLASFGSGNIGPDSGLVVDGQGDVYGETAGGGAYGDGTVFEVVKGSNTVTTIASLGSANALPSGGLLLDGQGDLLGTSEAGGSDGDGTVFEIASGPPVVTTLASFNGTNGSEPAGGLVEDANGNLYGTTITGGSAGFGTVFEVPKGLGTATALGSFDAASGTSDYQMVLTQGNLFGTTTGDGTDNEGTVFEVALNTPTPTPTPSPTPTPTTTPTPTPTPTPISPPVGYPSRVALTAKPRSTTLGRPITLTATVKNLSHKHGTPAGSMTFIDGSTVLGTRSLRHGRASLSSASLQAGANTIEVEYRPSNGFASGSASIVETVRTGRSKKGKSAASTEPAAQRANPPQAIRVAQATTTFAAIVPGDPPALASSSKRHPEPSGVLG